MKGWDGDKTCPARADQGQREEKKSVQKQSGRGEEGPCSLLPSQQRTWVKGLCWRGREVAESCSPTQARWPLMLLLDERIREGGWQIQSTTKKITGRYSFLWITA